MMEQAMAARNARVSRKVGKSRIHASVEEIAKSLQGNWRAEHLFALKQALDAFDFPGTQLAECELDGEQQLQRLPGHNGVQVKGQTRRRARNDPKVDIRLHTFSM